MVWILLSLQRIFELGIHGAVPFSLAAKDIIDKLSVQGGGVSSQVDVWR